jgi:hypothetical protein
VKRYHVFGTLVTDMDFKEIYGAPTVYLASDVDECITALEKERDRLARLESEAVPDAKRYQLPKSPEEYLRSRGAHIIRDYYGTHRGLGERVNEMAKEVADIRQRAATAEAKLAAIAERDKRLREEAREKVIAELNKGYNCDTPSQIADRILSAIFGEEEETHA